MLYPRLALALIFCLPAATGLGLIFPLAARSLARVGDMLKLYLAAGLGTVIAPLLFIGCLGIGLPPSTSAFDMILRLATITMMILALVALRGTIFGSNKKTLAVITNILCLTAGKLCRRRLISCKATGR